MTLLQDAATAYRAERARYWVRRRRVGERSVPGGMVAILVTDVDLEDGTRVFTGPEDDAKAWLDQTCLKSALERLCQHPALLEAVGKPPLDTVRSMLGGA